MSFPFLDVVQRHCVKGTHYKSCQIMSSRVKVETHAIIKVCVKLGMMPTQTYGKRTGANMNYKVFKRLIFKWHKRFRNGRESLEDDFRSGRSVNVK